MIRNAFRKWGAISVTALDQVKVMKTAPLPVAGFEGTKKFIQFTATRDKAGTWAIHSDTNIKDKNLPVFSDIGRAYHQSLMRHNGYGPSAASQKALPLETALLVLRDMEEAFGDTDGVARVATLHHYSVALGFLPAEFKTGFDEVHATRAPAASVKTPRAPKI